MEIYHGTWKSCQAKCKKLLVAAGFPWSTTTGRYRPFDNQQVTTKGIRVTRLGCSDTVSCSAHGYSRDITSAAREERLWMEALAIQTLREAGLPVDDRGWIECDRRSY